MWKHDDYERLANENWDREIPYLEQRGLITDRNGEVIVGNTLAPSLYFMRARNDDLQQAASKIATVLQQDEQSSTLHLYLSN